MALLPIEANLARRKNVISIRQKGTINGIVSRESDLSEYPQKFLERSNENCETCVLQQIDIFGVSVFKEQTRHH